MDCLYKIKGVNYLIGLYVTFRVRTPSLPRWASSWASWWIMELSYDSDFQFDVVVSLFFIGKVFETCNNTSSGYYINLDHGSWDTQESRHTRVTTYTKIIISLTTGNCLGTHFYLYLKSQIIQLNNNLNSTQLNSGPKWWSSNITFRVQGIMIILSSR